MTHADNLARVRATCLLARAPEGAVEATANKYEPTLADVLLALGKTEKAKLEEHRRRRYCVGDDGEIAFSQTHEFSVEKHEGCRTTYIKWNLRLPLSGQSEDTVRYLAELLKPND